MSDNRMQQLAQEIEGRNLWDELFQVRDQQRERKDISIWLVRGDEVPVQNSAQGLHKWYMHPNLEMPCINTLKFSVGKSPSPGGRSGRMAHLGN